MAITENRAASTGGDEAAIAELQDIVERQRAAFLADPFPSLEERYELLGALAGMLMSNRTQIQEAMSSDFGVHPPLAADLIETLGPAGRAVYAAQQLAGWIAPEPRESDPALFGTGRAFVQPQPKGVIGNIVPWNFPFDLSVGPLIEMLAAGNRVVIKPSEYTPACAELLREMVMRRSTGTESTSSSAAWTSRARSRTSAGTTSSIPAVRRLDGRSPRPRPSSSYR
jgi:coniferyl-aldehyde dehydrogenase